MMKKAVIVAVGILTFGSAWAATHVFDVPKGQTKTFSAMETALGVTIANSGDVIIKRGEGILQWNNGYSDRSFVLTNEAGVVAITESMTANTKAGKVFVKKGAAFSIATALSQVLQNWRFCFEGEGTGTAPYLGALVCEKTNGNGQILYGRFEMTGDATIYTAKGVANYMFSASSTTSYSELNMNYHTLTVRGAGATGDSNGSLFRPRWGWTITSAGTIVADNILFARHANSSATMDVYTLPRIRLVNGAKISLDGYYYQKVKEFDFEYGTTMGFSVSSPGPGGATGAKPTLRNLTGAPTIASATTSCTVTNLFVVRATDLAQAHVLTAPSATLAFGAACRVKITDVYARAWTKDEPVTIATASAITGTPAIDPSQADLFTVANTGTALTVTPKFTSVTVADWGIRPGAEYAAANAAAIAENVSALDDGMPLVFTEAGDYYFGDYLDFSGVTAANVRILSSESLSDPVNIHATVKVGAVTNFSLAGVTVKGVDGPAVIATGTQGLVIKNLRADAVVGTYGAGAATKRYPFVMNGVAGLEVTDFTVANCTNLWDDSALFAGEGSQTANSVVREGEIIADVRLGKAPDTGNTNWYMMNYVMGSNMLNLAEAAFENKTFVVVGDGATIDGGVNLAKLGLSNVVIRCGQYVARSNAALGVHASPVEVCDGASLTIAADGNALTNRLVRFAGNGIGDTTPAIRFTGSAVWNKTQNVTYELTGDATMYNNATGENGVFLYSKVKTNGHKLTLKGVSGSNYRFGRDCQWYGGGEVVVKSGITLSASTKGSNAFMIRDGADPKFVFEGTAKFMPDSTDIFGIVKDCAFAKTAMLDLKSATTPFAMSFVNLKGAPIVNERIPSLTVTGTYLANKADLAADKYLTLAGAFTWGNGATADVDGVEGIRGKTFIHAEGGVANKPSVGSVLAAADYVVRRQDARTLVVGYAVGFSILMR